MSLEPKSRFSYESEGDAGGSPQTGASKQEQHATPHLPRPRTPQPLVAIAEVEWEGATLGVGTIDLKSDTADNELVYECVCA